MIIYFTETETSEEQFFAQELAEHDLGFVQSVDEVPENVELLSCFIYSRITKAFLDRHPKLRHIATRSTGFHHIDAEECKARGIQISIVPSYGDHTVAEHTFALMLALSRRLRESMQAQRASQFSYEAIRGIELTNKMLGVVGTGRIGLHTIRIAKAFGMNAMAYDIHPQPFMAEMLGFRYVELDELLAESDVITLHIPLFTNTHHLLNRSRFAKCKPGVLVVNTAHGALIDTEALIEALDQGIVGGAGLDVLEEERILQKETIDIISDQIVSQLQSGRSAEEVRFSNPQRIQELQRLMRNSELLSRPNVVFTPHVAFNSIEAIARINQTVLANIRAFLNDHPTNLVAEMP